MGSEKGFLVEYFSGKDFDKNLVMQEHLVGNKFWVFEGFAKKHCPLILTPGLQFMQCVLFLLQVHFTRRLLGVWRVFLFVVIDGKSIVYWGERHDWG